MADVLLVHAPDAYTRGFVGSMPPLGLAWLATTLERLGLDVAIADMHVETQPFRELLTAAAPGIIGISSTTAARFAAFGYAREARDLFPDSLILMGGAHVSCAAGDTLEGAPEVDAVVRGEGEHALRLIVERGHGQQRNFADIPSISYRRNGVVVHNPDAARQRDLDALGFPARHLLPMEAYDLENEFLGGRAFHVSATRGCPYLCAFCSAAAIWGRRYTFRSPRHVVDELEILRDEYRADGIRFMDALLTVDKAYAMRICREMRDRKLGLPWECEIRVDTVNEELLRGMREAGCYYLDFGVESINARVLKLMRKQIVPEQIRAVLKLAHALGFKTKVFFTLGHIGETPAEARETLAFIRRSRRLISRVGGGVGISIYPGTEVERYARKIGCLPPDFSWAQPYVAEDNLYFSASPHVPLLVQDQMTLTDLRALRRRHILLKLQDPSVWLANLRRLTDGSVLRRGRHALRGILGRRRSGGPGSMTRP